MKTKGYNYFNALNELYTCILNVSEASKTKTVNYNIVLNQSNSILHDIKTQLYKDFITPIDREDIFEIATLLHTQVQNIITLNNLLLHFTHSKLDINYYKISEKIDHTQKNVHKIITELQYKKKSPEIENIFIEQSIIFSELNLCKCNLLVSNISILSSSTTTEMIKKQTLERELINIIDTYKTIVFTIEKIILKNL